MLGQWLTDVNPAQPRQLPDLRPRRDRVEPPAGGVRRHRQAVERGVLRPDVDEHLARAGRVMEMLSRAPVPGLARGLPADRPARPVQLLRGVHPHHRLDVQPARQVAEGHQPHPVAPADREPELPAVQPCLAPGPQRVQPPGPRVHRPRGQQAAPRWSGCTCRRTPTRCCPPTTTACAAGSTSTWWWRASSRRPTS